MRNTGFAGRLPSVAALTAAWLSVVAGLAACHSNKADAKGTEDASATSGNTKGGGGNKGAAPGGGGAGATAPRAEVPDTALLTPEAVRIAGFATARAELVPWRASWAAPARLALDPAATQPLGSIVEGRVVRVLAQPGDPVRRNQVLVILHSDEMLDARNKLAQARATRAQAGVDLEAARATTARAERLYAAKAGSLAELERARTAQADALAGRRRADAELSYASEYVEHLLGAGPVPAGVDAHEVLVRAPFDGVVTARDAQAGSVVAVGAPLVTVSRLGALALTLRLPEQALGVARPGAEVRFTVPAYGERQFAARVTRVSPVLDSVSRTAEVRALVPNANGALKAEMTASAQLLGPPEAQRVLAVPTDAVQELEGDTVVVTATGAGNGTVLEAVTVRPGRRSAGLAEIRDGLAPGATVVTQGAGIAKAEIVRRREQRNGGAGGGGGG